MKIKYTNKVYKKSLEKIIHSPILIWKKKIKEIIEFLKELVGENIRFQEMDESVINNMDIYLKNCCSSNQKDGKTTSTNIPCLYENDKCIFLISKKNLISSLDNEEIYYGKLADELIRYKRIQLFMFQPQSFFNISNQTYKINKKEFIILQKSLNHEYFNNIRIFNTAPQIKNTDFVFADPNKHISYTDKVDFQAEQELIVQKPRVRNIQNPTDKKEENIFVHQCILEIKDVVGEWKKEFPPTTKEINFKNTNICSYSPVIYILQQKFKGVNINVENIQKILIDGYSLYLNKYSKKIYEVLKKQGKKHLINSIETQNSTFERIIYSDEYYLTDLDYWIISIQTQTPIILFNSIFLKNMVINISWLYLGGGNITDNIYFIRSPSLTNKGEPPKYGLIIPSFKYIELKQMKTCIQSVIEKRDFERNTIPLIQFLSQS